MGDVYLARDRRLERKVALKLLPVEFTTDEIRLRRFTMEARATSSLNHPNIITIHEIGQAGDLHFIAAEFVAGQTLREHISQGRMNAGKALDVAVQVAGALAAAHAAGIVHRDIKPDNIMLRPDGYVKVLDFGLAKLTERPLFSRDTGATTVARVDTQPGTVMGTAHYLSPEQARGQDVDARSDIFNLGVVIYEMIGGRLPFDGETSADVMASILKSDPHPLAELAPDCPAEIQRIVARALAKDKDQRYQTSDDILLDLKTVKADLEFQSKRESSGEAPATDYQPPIAPARRANKTLGLIFVLVPVLLAALIIAFGPGKTQTPRPSGLKFAELHSWKSERGETVEADPRFSGNGKMITFTAQKDGRMAIWVKQTVSGAEAHLITRDNDNNWYPIWSPDDQRVAYVSDRGEQNAIWSVPYLGGTPVLLGLVPDLGVKPRHWSKDGNTIYYQWLSNLYALDISSKATTKLTSFDQSKLPPRSFSISPLEDQIAYVDDIGGQLDIWVSSLGGEGARRVTNDPEDDRFPIWLPGGDGFVYTSDRGGTHQICRVFLDGSPPLQVTVGGNDHEVSDISHDGTRLLTIGEQGSSDVFAVDVESGSEVELTSGTGLKLWPEVSPKGDLVAYQSAPSLSRLLSSVISTVTSTGERGQVLVASDGFNVSWSPDASHLAFLRYGNGSVNLFTTSLSSREERQFTSEKVFISGYSALPSNYYGKDLSWSPDGRRIAYSSLESGTTNIGIASLDGSTTHITSNLDPSLLIAQPVWAASGDNIAYLSQTTPGPDGKSTWTVWVSGAGTPKEIFRARSTLVRIVGWSESGHSLIVAKDEEGDGIMELPMRVRLLEVTLAGQSREIGSLDSAYIATIRLSADKRNLAFVASRSKIDNLWIASAEGGEERRITANTDPKLYLSHLAWSPDGRMLYYGKQTGIGVITIVDNFN